MRDLTHAADPMPHRGSPRHGARPARALACVVLAITAVVASPAVAAAATAPPNDAAAHASIVTGTGGSVRIDATAATTEATDPLPSCSGAGAARGTVWLALRPLAHVRVTVTAAAAGHATLASVYAGAPLAGTEVSCARRAAGSYPVAASGAANPPATIDVVLAPRITYWLMVGTEGAGDVIDLTVVVRGTAWRATQPLPARRQGIAAAADARYLYAFGGYQTSYLPGAQSGFHSLAVNRLDPATGAWSTIAQMPTGLSYARAARIGGRIYIPGGQSNAVNGAGCLDGSHLVFDIATRRFSRARTYPGGDNPTQVLYDYAVAADARRGAYYMAGGRYDPTPCDFGGRSDQQATGVVRSFSPRTGAWTQLPPMPTPRHGPVAQVAAGWLYVIGGFQGSRALASVEAYDPVARVWYRASDLPVPVYGAAGGLGQTADGRPVIVVAGGWTTGGETGVTQVYDVWSNRWTLRGTGTRMTARDALGAAVTWGRLYAVGGVQRQPTRATEYLTIDALPPAATGRSTVAGTRVTLAAAASDSSGIASVRWRFADGRVLTGTRVSRDFATAGARSATLVVRDRAGNVRTRTVRFTIG